MAKATAEKARNRITKIRRKKGLSLDDLARRFQRARAKANFETDLEFVKRAEAGENIYLIPDGQALARALRVTVDDLYPPRRRRQFSA